jgi:UDP-glucose 4-epimerase
MYETFIIGTVNLSTYLRNNLNSSKIYSAKIFLKNIKLINKRKKKFNLIINSFYTSTKLNEIKLYKLFIKKTNYEISEILDKINYGVINKIIYTSSSSVYGLIKKINFLNINNDREIYAAFKISTESLLKNYCSKKKIPLIICRIFNLYGGNDKFSILQKIKKIKKNKQILEINNNGLSVRDFIHIHDVTKIYSHILANVSVSNLFDIGTGKGVTIAEIFKKLNLDNKYFIFKKKQINEINCSIADNKNLLKNFPKIKFKTIEDYLKIKVKLKYKII